MKQNQDPEILQKKSWEVFAVAREESIEAPPYLKTRVLQELQSRQRQHSRILLWRRMSARFSATSRAEDKTRPRVT